MGRVIKYLGVRPWLAAGIVGAYVLSTVVSHDVAQSIVFWLQDHVGPRHWLGGVSIAALIAAFVAATLLARAARGRPDGWIIATYSLVTLALAGGCYFALIMVANECIHFAQYALLAILIFPLTRRYGETVAWCALIGLMDEAYQYFVLHASWYVYFDFNDVVLNVVGAGLGVVALRAALSAGFIRRRPFSPQRPVYVGLAVLALGCAALSVTGHLRAAPPRHPTTWTIALRRCPPAPSFWVHYEPGKDYHELRPVEGVCVLLALLALYAGLDVLDPATRAVRKPMSAGAADTMTIPLAAKAEPPARE